jgi:outer membrane protein insertion porin family
VRPSVRVEAGPRVRFSARGAKISRGTLRRLVPVFEERSVDRDLLEEGARNIAEYFQGRGYFDARVTFGRSDLEQGEQLIEYVIEPGQRSKLERIVIEGNRYFREETIRERLAMTPASFQFRYGRFSQSILDRDAAAIRELYQTNGFEDIRVAGQVHTLEDGGREVTLRITEGPQYRVRNLELVGIPEEDEEDIRYLLSSIEGQPFSTSNVAIDRDLVLARYFDLGYPEALFEWTATPVEGAPRVDLSFTLTLGERRVVREVLVSGLDETRPEVVERRVVMHPGDPLSLSRMVDIQRRLYALGIFSKVDMAIQNPEGDEELKSVQYDLEESRRYSLTGGVGAEFGRFGGRGSQAPAGSTTFAPRVSFNITRLNFRGRAHTVSLKTQASTLQRRGLFTYLAPSFQNKEKLTLSFTTLADDSRDIRTFTARRYEGSVQLAQNVSRIYTALYRFSYRVVKVSDLQISPLLIPQVSQAARIGILSGTLIQDRRDDPTNATRGLYSTVDLGVAARAFGSENGFVRLVATNSTYHRLTPRIVFARTTTFGWLPAFGQIRLGGTDELFPNVPLAERFFAGGSSSHRGFPQNQAGPRDPATGFPLGGTALLANGLEFRFPLLGENLGGVLFHDTGNVFSRLNDISFRSHQRDLRDFSYLVHALGFGVRYNTPIGPVRLDVAYGLNSPRFFVSPPGDPQGCVSPELGCPTDRIRAFQFHFSLGQAF